MRSGTIASPDHPFPVNSDAEEDTASPNSSISNFSSCDGSDLDRYCSANSALGTASVCSSVGKYDVSGIAGLGRGGIESPRANGNVRGPDRRRLGSDDEDDSGIEGGDDEDGEAGVRKVLRRSKEIDSGIGNPLLISSSVAFGCDDWDDFMRESEMSYLPSPSWRQSQGDQQQLRTLEAGDGVHEEDGMKNDVSVEKNQEDHSIALLTESGRSCGDHEGPHMQRHIGSQEEAEAVSPEDLAGADTDWNLEKRAFAESEVLIALPANSAGVQPFSASIKALNKGTEIETLHEEEKGSFPLIGGNDREFGSVRIVKEDSGYADFGEEGIDLGEVSTVRKQNINDGCDEMVLEMEEILLDSGKSLGPRFTQANQAHLVQQSHHFRDDNSTASTSGTEDSYSFVQGSRRIDWVEVVGAKQKSGDVSFGERLVGVKEYTLYRIRVWSGKDQWEVERRYRDFFALYRHLRTLFSDHGLSLPSPWSIVERDSRKYFGNVSPNVIAERSSLIQECLRAILSLRTPFGIPSSLLSFLSPGEAVTHVNLFKDLISQSLQKQEDENSKSSHNGEISSGDVSSMGKTISLLVELKPHKSMRQLLEVQHYTCAGCHRHLDLGNSRLQEFVQTFTRNRPRFCEYTGQLFCVLCHTNDSAVLPARVLHLWDFSLYPVSQLAKAYLDSIYDQPMLCVSAVNPFLFSKVPALLNVMGVRKRIGSMFPYLHCPFRRAIQKGLGLRRYLLESNDFFALRDLVDLSKGAFAALPVIVETIASKIFEHITQQCLVCYDAGVPCAARQACDDPSSLIFPFQEVEAIKCGSCGSIFHKPCFDKLLTCPCGKRTSANRTEGPTEQVRAAASKEFDEYLGRIIDPPESNSMSGLMTDNFSKVKSDKIWKAKNSSPVILMGSLPSNSL